MIPFLRIYCKEKKALNIQKDAHNIYNSKEEGNTTCLMKRCGHCLLECPHKEMSQLMFPRNNIKVRKEVYI